jgi:hypothetical protein
VCLSVVGAILPDVEGNKPAEETPANFAAAILGNTHDTSSPSADDPRAGRRPRAGTEPIDAGAAAGENVHQQGLRRLHGFGKKITARTSGVTIDHLEVEEHKILTRGDGQTGSITMALQGLRVAHDQSGLTPDDGACGSSSVLKRKDKQRE